ncbi:MAG TPA: YMGG-like glycine zipper-containing protein [Longimicrobium sp.]|nr:YMGG-like glycine zipper-containing protein [Longimicrobium sp.]
MRVLKMAMIMSTLVGAAACSREAQPAAERQRQLTWLDSLMTQPAQQPVAAASALELNQAPTAQPAAPLAVAQVEEKPAAAAPARRASSTHHSSTSGRRHRSSSSGTYASAPVYRQPRVATVKHTRRDAAIGAGTGAVLGAIAGGGRHRVRGAIVGGVLGGVAGAVIGNNVDKSHRIQY